MSWRSSTTGLLLLSAAAAQACVTDDVPTTQRSDASAPPAPGADAAADGGTPPVGLDGGQPGTGQEAGPANDTGAQQPPAGDGGTTPASEGGANNGPCDLTGNWLITQRTVYQALGVRQAGVYWYYYELDQSGSELTVKKGLSCGGETKPIDLLSGAVAMEESWPGMLKNNPHAGRKGNASSSGGECNVSFNRTTTVIGATCPYYVDEKNALPTMQASGSTPGWEDWDEDGQPGVSLHISGLASGARYTVVRLVNDWSGTFTPGATSLKLKAVPEQIESVLGATAELLKATAEPDADMSVHYAQFAKLQAGQVQGDDTAMCAKVRELAPMLMPEANQ